MNLLRARRGLISLLARELPLSRSAISEWKVVPADRLIEVERISKIPRERLRPDLYDMRGRQVEK